MLLCFKQHNDAIRRSVKILKQIKVKKKKLKKILGSKGVQEQLNIKFLRRNLVHQLHLIKYFITEAPII